MGSIERYMDMYIKVGRIYYQQIRKVNYIKGFVNIV